ncbi:MAG: hypothetical protein ABIQ84_00560 [Usitatibacter sp.]
MSKSHAAILILSATATLAACVDSQDTVTEPRAKAVEAASPMLRVKEDLARGTRWELGWGTVYVYDIATGRLLQSVSLQGANLSASRDTRLPDMVLSRSGALIVSSNAQPSLWRISPERFEVERFDVELDRDNDKDFGFSDLAWSADGRELHALSAATGSAWRIDLARGKATKVGVE